MRPPEGHAALWKAIWFQGVMVHDRRNQFVLERISKKMFLGRINGQNKQKGRRGGDGGDT